MLSRTQETDLTFEPIDEPMDPHATHLHSEPPRGGPLKFSHASGSRPLSGYTIKRGIGRGGFGEVYFAVSDGGKEVALKLIRHNLDVELRGVTHCLNLKHPNLIALYDVRQDDQDNSWVVMEYATGESLEEVIDRHPQGISPEDAFDWMQGIAAGAAYLHDHGIVHRDLKPGNIFRDDGQVKLGDYGLSKFISCSRRSGQTESIGTVHYMAPEVANGRYGKEIDIYALGIILYEMLTGHVPFEGESVGEVLMKHLTAEPSLDALPEAYRVVIARALAKDPVSRFASVGEFFNALPPLASTMAYRPPLAETRYPASESPEPQPAPKAESQPQPHAAQAALGAGLAGAQAAANAVDDEPVWRTIRQGWQNARDSWDGLNTPTKIIVAVVGCAALAYNAELVLSLVVPAVMLYIIYRIARAVVLQQDAKRQGALGVPPRDPMSSAPSPPVRPAPPVSPAGNSPQPANLHETTYQPQKPNTAQPGDWRKASQRHWKRTGRRWREQAAEALVVKPGRERVADLAGAMLMAAIVASVMSIVAVLLRGETAIEREQFAWLTLNSVLGTWAVLIPSKFWEGTEGDQTLRRVVMLIVGLGVGAAAYFSADFLQVRFGDSPKLHLENTGLADKFYDVQGTPMIYAFLAYFAAMFALVRWWRQSDPLRRTRLSVWSTGVCVLAAWLVDAVWRFPQPWGIMIFAIMSTSVQLVSPHVTSPNHRERLAGKE